MTEPVAGPTIGDWATLYAAVLATLVGLFQVASVLRNRPRLKLELVDTYEATDDDEGHGPAIVVLKVVNLSQRPVAIEHAGVVLKSGQYIRFPGEPRREPLTEGFPLVYQQDRDALIGELIAYGPGTRIASTYAKDYFGKVHRSRASAEWASFASAIVDEYGTRRANRQK
jgi:hypothetical protein